MVIHAGDCTPNQNQDALLPPAFAGHGTHTAGLVAANGAAGLDVQGKSCGLAMTQSSHRLDAPSVLCIRFI